MSKAKSVFACQACGQLLYFENVRCERCSRALGFLPDGMIISAIEAASDEDIRVRLSADYADSAETLIRSVSIVSVIRSRSDRW